MHSSSARSAILASALLAIMIPSPSNGDDFADVPIIDTHIHLYDVTRPEGAPWPPESDKVLYRAVLPEHFDAVADANGVAATVIVEASAWPADNQWVLDLVAHNPDRYIGLVGNLALGEDGFAKQLRELSSDKRFVGIRMRQRTGGAESYTDAVWRDLQLLADSDKTLDVLVRQITLEDVAAIAQRVPNLKILINHVANADIDGGAPSDEWVAQLNKTASHAKVHCKISGLFQQSHQSPSPKDLEFYKETLDAVTAAFGPDRLIYGSNWPVSMRGGNYGDYKKIVMEYYGPKGRPFLEKLLYKNALKFYGLEDWKTP